MQIKDVGIKSVFLIEKFWWAKKIIFSIIGDVILDFGIIGVAKWEISRIRIL